MGGRYFLAEVLGEQGFNRQTLEWPAEPAFGYGVAPLALADKVVAQKQEPLYMDLLNDGSYLISGLSVSGKTTYLRTMLTTLALTHRPDEMRFCLIDLGNNLKTFAGLPHQTRYISMAEQDLLKGVFKELDEELRERKKLFANAGVLDLTSYRRQVGKMPSLFVLFDNYTSIRHNPPFDVEIAKTIIREGRPYGFHMALTVEKANDFEYGRMSEQFFQVALRQLRDDISFPVPKNMIGSWNDRPGRGFIRGGHNQPPIEVQAYLPCQAEPAEQVKELEKLIICLQEAAARNPAWVDLNSPVETPSGPPPQNALTPAASPPISASTVALIKEEAVAEPVAELEETRQKWADLLALDDLDDPVEVAPADALLSLEDLERLKTEAANGSAQPADALAPTPVKETTHSAPARSAPSRAGSQRTSGYLSQEQPALLQTTAKDEAVAPLSWPVAPKIQEQPDSSAPLADGGEPEPAQAGGKEGRRMRI